MFKKYDSFEIMLGANALHRLALCHNAADKLHPVQVTNSCLNIAFLCWKLIGKPQAKLLKQLICDGILRSFKKCVKLKGVYH